MQSLATVLCQIWGQFRWNLVLHGSKCPVLKWVHQTARSPNWLIDTELNHSASIPIWSGRSTCAVTRSDLMRLSHSWTPKLNILEILTHFWPASEPCRQATITDMDFMFPVPALPLPYLATLKIWRHGHAQRLATVLCQIWGQFRWNLVLYGPKCPILKGVHQTARSPNGLYIQDWIIQRRFQCDRAINLCSYNDWPYAGQSQLDAKIEYSWNFNTFLTCIGAL